MARQRRRIFGPLLYSTLVLAVIATATTWVVTVGADRMRTAGEREQLNAFATMLQNANPAIRERGAKFLLTKGPEVALPYLLEAARDPHSAARALACRSLVEAFADPAVVAPVLIAAAGDDRDEVRLEVARGLGRVRLHGALASGRSESPHEDEEPRNPEPFAQGIRAARSGPRRSRRSASSSPTRQRPPALPQPPATKTEPYALPQRGHR